MAQSAKKEIQSDTLEIEQKPAISGNERKPDALLTDPALKQALSSEYLAELAFNEEPVLVRLEPAGGDNPVKVFPIWNNGIACELRVNSGGCVENLEDSGRWMQMPNGFVPVGRNIVMKRKYLATLVTSKKDRITTEFGAISPHAERNDAVPSTTSAQPWSVIEDKNPLGRPWLRELMRRNF